MFPKTRSGAAALLIAAAALLAPLRPALAQVPNLPPGCTPQTPLPCAYQPQQVYNAADIGIFDTVLKDPARRDHPVPIRVRYPKPATGALPVVILSHGGTTADDEGGYTLNTSSERGNSFARSGYVVVHVTRLMVEPQALTDAQFNDCINAGTVTSSLLGGANVEGARRACRVFIGWKVYGPQNVAFIANVIKGYQRGMIADFAGTLDATKVAVGGWSGGTEASMNIAGASQTWTSKLNTLRGGTATSFTVPPTRIDNVVALMADSPRAPEWITGSGFGESLWNIDERPFLFVSGRYDTGGDAGPNVSRTSSFMSARPGRKFLAWTLHERAIHATMNIGEEGCTPLSDAARQSMCTALANLSVAFLDSAVKGRQQATDWLATDAFRALSNQLFELHRR